MRWVWDDSKNLINRKKHGLGFETAQLIFGDPLAVSREEPHPDEERWQTIGMIGNVMVIVVHTFPWTGLDTGEVTGRIVSARKATPHERRLYEQGNF